MHQIKKKEKKHFSMIKKYVNLKKSKLLKAKHTYARISYFLNAHSIDKQKYLTIQKSIN